MGLGDYLPFWNRLTEAERKTLEEATTMRNAPKGTILHNGSADCVGLFVVKKRTAACLYRFGRRQGDYAVSFAGTGHFACSRRPA